MPQKVTPDLSPRSLLSESITSLKVYVAGVPLTAVTMSLISSSSKNEIVQGCTGRIIVRSNETELSRVVNSALVLSFGT